MKDKSILFSSKSDEWQTPIDKWSLWNEEFQFTFDAAANENNHLCVRWSNDSLDTSWNGRVWCNPPYSKVKEFVSKAFNEISLNPNCEIIVMLIPARTDTRWFHQYIYNQPNIEIRLLKGRLKFIDPSGDSLRKGHTPNSAPFPSMLVIFRK